MIYKKYKQETVEYEDMTEKQKRIVDAAESPPVYHVPKNRKPGELLQWLIENFGTKKH